MVGTVELPNSSIHVATLLHCQYEPDKRVDVEPARSTP